RAATSKLQRLKELGISCAIDDFGTGYAGFQYLQELPIDIIKIDRSFVQRAASAHDRHGPAMVKMIMLLAESLGLSVIAEGVEKPQERALLQSLGCPVMQGYLLAKPMSADDAKKLLMERNANIHAQEALAAHG